MKHLLSTSTFLVLVLGLSACGPLTPGSFEDIPPIQQEFSSEGVKWITSEVENGRDERTFDQEAYVLSPKSRLLIRLQKFNDESTVNRVRLDKDNKVELVLTATQPKETLSAVETLRVCPLRKSWMMLATWERAHPFTPAGKWTHSGGDWDWSECISPTMPQAEVGPPAPGAAAASADGSQQVWLFDVTPWFKNYVKGKRVNYGLIVISDTTSFAIHGDRSGLYSPRLRWKE